ncbi:MAG: hypothetical protein H6732_13100 [Alphaproteobacteria bacterium]|nr:hypothetical protein [Alphaproteobacteria bacterium]
MSPVPSPLAASAWAFVEVVLPVVAGDLAGAAWARRRSHPPGWGALVLVLVACVALPVVATVGLRGPGLWDAALVGGAVWLGLAVGARGGAWPRLLGQGLLALALGEGLAWALLPTPPGIPRPLRAPWASWATDVTDVHGGTWSTDVEACRVVFSAPGRLPARPRVLHVGDSMVFGSGVADHETFVASLGRRRPTEAHVALAAPGLSTDGELLAVRRWVAAGAWDAVVLYVFAGNDLAEVDRVWPCCPGGGLLEGPRARCAEPAWPEGAAAARWRSPPPFALQVAAQGLRSAAWGYAAWAAGRGGLVQPRADELDAAVTRVADLAATLAREAQAAGAAASVVLLPAPPGADLAAPERQARLFGALRETGVHLVDATAFFAAPPIARDALTVDGMHLSPAGHEAFASWVEEGVLERGAPASSGVDPRPLPDSPGP